MDDVAQVGGKNASLGEMIQQLSERDIRIPGGFATTAKAYRRFVEDNGIKDVLDEELKALHDETRSLDTVGERIRKAFRRSEFPEEIADAIRKAYRDLCDHSDTEEVSVAVRSSATAEDLPDASFAGQQETYLNVTGEDDLLDACRDCYASLFTDRAIAYREEKDFDHLKVALSVGVQRMIRADKGGAGVMFSIDTETGFPDVVVIDAAWGLGENVVQGSVTPDEYRVFKPLLDHDDLRPLLQKQLGAKEKMMVYAKGGKQTTRNKETPKTKRRSFVLSDDEILQLARWAARIEEHYGKPMDMEWGRDGEDGPLYILQARPETVQSQKESSSLKRYRLKERGDVRVEGLSIGAGISSGKVKCLDSPDRQDEFEEGDVLVTDMTDPDWVPIMKKAAAIVTDHGGRTSHAAIVSRELGATAVVGAGDATDILTDGDEVTVSCAEGETGFIYDGLLDFEEKDIDLDALPEAPVDIMMNLATPGSAFRWWRLPAKGVGLARMEFIINNLIRVHPMALLHPNRVPNEVRHEIKQLTRGYDSSEEYFVETLARGLASIGASQYPEKVIVRLSDFKTNEYADLLGGTTFEPQEENPMLGFRGAARYTHERYREGFALECRAVRRARRKIGLDNIAVMIPFARTPEEVDRVLDAMEKEGLKRGEENLEVYLMCEIPSNVLLADQFAQRVDGFSIGSNDLTQLVLGVDRDSDLLADLFDEQHEAVKRAIRDVIHTAHEHDTKVGICGQAPSDYPEFAAFLVENGIDTMSLNPDSVVEVIETLSKQT